MSKLETTLISYSDGDKKNTIICEWAAFQISRRVLKMLSILFVCSSVRRSQNFPCLLPNLIVETFHRKSPTDNLSQKKIRMDNNFLTRGADVVKLAIKADEEQRYKDAVKQYRQAGELFVLALKYETNPEVRNQIKSRLSGYITRAEELQKALDNGKYVFRLSIMSVICLMRTLRYDNIDYRNALYVICL